MSSKYEPIWSQIETSVADISGWSPIDELYSLYLLALGATEVQGDIVEIGGWCGRSSVALGMAARDIDKQLYCIDLFPSKDDWYQSGEESYSFEVIIDNKKYAGYQDQKVHKEPFEKAILPVYEQYYSILDAWKLSMENNKLSNYASPHIGDCLSFFKTKSQDYKVSFAFLDGDHSYDGLSKDIITIEKYLSSGGIICFDDAFSSHYPGVDEAINEFIINSDKYLWAQQMTRKFFVAKRK